MLKFKIFFVLLFSSMVWAIPFNVEVVKTGEGDEIRAGQLIKVHYKGYLYADIVKFDSLKVVADSVAKADSIAKATAPKPDAKKVAKKADKKAEEVKPRIALRKVPRSIRSLRLPIRMQVANPWNSPSAWAR